ncbi:hypothetical protein [Micromonospora sp. RTGN7]|uniref:hypothetical protein n=1 Tax=Micromonospora sp. RTGN7 TaxID=3016526 RepID=UPI0029FF2AB1|nr:hypothetical protein [Micromonospora sp. RTGN7]
MSRRGPPAPADLPTPSNAPATPPGADGSGPITAGGIPGIASTGANATNTQHVTVLPAEALVASEEVPAPAGLVNLPGRRRLFVGRAGA